MTKFFVVVVVKKQKNSPIFMKKIPSPTLKNFTHAHYAANIVPYTKDELFTDTISFIPNLYISDHSIIGIIYKFGGEEKE